MGIIYGKIKRFDNSNPMYNWVPKKGELVTVEEKIDGSNLSFHNDDGKLRVYSSNNEMTDNLAGFTGLAAFIEENKVGLLKSIPKGNYLVGEWLGLAKLGYNGMASTNKNGICRFYPYDLITELIIESDQETRVMADINALEDVLVRVELFCHNIGITPVLEDEIPMSDVAYFYENYVLNKGSYLARGSRTTTVFPDIDVIREGIVIKSLDRQHRVKVVSESFSEKTKKPKNNVTKEVPITKLINECLTPARLEKFKQRLINSGVDISNISAYFKNSSDLFNDIWEEELDAIKQACEKTVKRELMKAIGVNFGVGE